MNKLSAITVCLLTVLAALFASCNPEAKYETKDVEIKMDVRIVSAGFIECSFATNKDAYYLIDCKPAVPGVDPLKYQKQFMTLALDSANMEYMAWRNGLLREGEFTIAPFASHSLQYGSIDHFFTGLWYETDYWVYAFAVDPVKMEPVSKLYLQTVRTPYESIESVRFDYRVHGRWDYVYPLDSVSGHVNAHFPYVTTTRDSLEVVQDIKEASDTDLYAFLKTPGEYFTVWLLYQSTHPEEARVLYGVSAIENDGIGSYLTFEEGHTYYTFIGGYDFSSRQNTLYKFRWEGEKTELYFTEKDNIAWDEIIIDN